MARLRERHWRCRAKLRRSRWQTRRRHDYALTCSLLQTYSRSASSFYFGSATTRQFCRSISFSAHRVAAVSPAAAAVVAYICAQFSFMTCRDDTLMSLARVLSYSAHAGPLPCAPVRSAGASSSAHYFRYTQHRHSSAAEAPRRPRESAPWI